MKISKKRSGYGLEVKTIQGGKGTYLFFRAKNGGYHTFLEVAAKDAARDCGAKIEGNTRQMCKKVWDNN
jgi:hypothetical protein